MTRTRPDEERVWLQAMISALGGLSTIDPPREVHASGVDWAEINQRFAQDAARMADEAIVQWRERYPAEPPPAKEEESGL